MVSQGLSARLLANHGQYGYAEQLVRSAGALAAQTDLLSERAESLPDLAHVLAAAGRLSEAHDAGLQALDPYRRKGNLPGSRESRRYLSRYAHA